MLDARILEPIFEPLLDAPGPATISGLLFTFSLEFENGLVFGPLEAFLTSLVVRPFTVATFLAAVPVAVFVLEAVGKPPGVRFVVVDPYSPKVPSR
jgi:hypothetical protein